MPYVNIKKSKLIASVSKQIGNLYGNLSNQIAATSLEMVQGYRRDGCPTEKNLLRNRGKVNQLFSTLSKTQRRLEKFRRLPRKLRRPVSGFKKALKVILSLPIPQSFPPGFGIPVSITTRYADLLHLVKEKIAQIEEDIEAIELMLEAPDELSGIINRQIARLNVATSTCEFEKSLQDDLEEGLVTEQELLELGLLDEDGIFITSKLLPSYVGGGNTLEPEGSTDEDLTDANNEFITIVSRLEKSNISQQVKDNVKTVLDSFDGLYLANPDTQDPDGCTYYTAPSGDVFCLKIIKDPNSPNLAPRRYAAALDNEGVEVLTGPKSFSSNTDVLIEEIKFRIDNQLP